MQERWQQLLSLGLQGRVLALALVPGVVLALLLGTVIISQRSQDLQQQLQERGQLLSRQLAAAADFGVFAGNQAALQTLVDAMAAEPSVRGARVVDVEGRSLAASGEMAVGMPPGPPWVGLDLASGNWQAPGDGWAAFAHPVKSPVVVEEDWLQPRSPGVVARRLNAYAVVEIDTTAVTREMRQFVLLAVGVLLLILPASAWVARRLSRSLVDPVTALAMAAQRVGRGQSGVRVRPDSGIKVLDRLAGGFNDMAQRLERSRDELEERVRQATQELQARKDAAEKADQAKTRFLAAASHDLRQPMHALSMFVSALEQEADLQRRQELQGRISSATQAMGDLLDALLDISKLDSGRMQAQLEPVALKPLLARLHATYSELAARRDIELVLKSRNAWVLTDAMLLERMVGNLLSNAIRYTPDGGAGKVLVAVRARGRDVRIEVRDNGPGIPAEAHEAIFEEFMQLNNPERDRGKGLGLGLAIVKRLSLLLGHEVAVRSTPGQGSTFSITLPLTSAPVQAEPAPPQPVAAAPRPATRVLEGRKVLVVDDDALAREGLSRVAMLWGAEVIESSGDGDVLASLQQSGWWPDLMLTDFRLRGAVDGLALVERVQEQARLTERRVPAVLITGDTERAHLRRLERPDLKVLFKPVRPPELRQTVEELIAPAVL